MEIKKDVPSEKGELSTQGHGALMVWFESLEQPRSKGVPFLNFHLGELINPPFSLKLFESDYIFLKIGKTYMNLSLIKPLKGNY